MTVIVFIFVKVTGQSGAIQRILCTGYKIKISSMNLSECVKKRKRNVWRVFRVSNDDRYADNPEFIKRIYCRKHHGEVHIVERLERERDGSKYFEQMGHLSTLQSDL